MSTQKLLAFDSPKEARRPERVERILGSTPKRTKAAKMFDDAAFLEATAIATRFAE